MALWRTSLSTSSQYYVSPYVSALPLEYKLTRCVVGVAVIVIFATLICGFYLPSKIDFSKSKIGNIQKRGQKERRSKDRSRNNVRINKQSLINENIDTNPKSIEQSTIKSPLTMDTQVLGSQAQAVKLERQRFKWYHRIRKSKSHHQRDSEANVGFPPKQT